MTNDTKQTDEHPGSEWIENEPEGELPECFWHPVLDRKVWFMSETRAEAVARCRAISAAALAWERMKLKAINPLYLVDPAAGTIEEIK